MSKRIAARALCVVALAGALAGCAAHASTPQQALANLRSESARDRRAAADDLRTLTSDRPPAHAAPALVRAIYAEHDAEALGAMLVALGATGAPEARPIIDFYLRVPNDPALGRWARRAQRKWVERHLWRAPIP